MTLHNSQNKELEVKCCLCPYENYCGSTTNNWYDCTKKEYKKEAQNRAVTKQVPWYNDADLDGWV